MLRLLAPLVAIGLCLGPAEAWTSSRGNAEGTMAAEVKNLGESWIAEFPEKDTLYRPAVDDAHVYTMISHRSGGSTLAALKRDTGKLAWNLVLPSSFTNLVSDGEAVYFATGRSNERQTVQLHKVHAADGVLLWSSDLEFVDVTATLTLGPYIYLAATQFNYLAAFNKTHGGLVWEKQMQLPLGEVLAVGERLLVADDAGVNLLNATDGRPIWRHKLLSHVGSASLATHDNIAVITTNPASAFALDLRTGNEQWTFEGAPGPNSVNFGFATVRFGPPMILGDHAYFASHIASPNGTGPGFLFGLHLYNGSQAWRMDLEQTGEAWAGLSLSGRNGTIYAALPAGLTAIDGKTGNKIWGLPPHGRGVLSFRDPAIAGGIIYWPAGGGHLWAISAHDGKVTGPTIQLDIGETASPAPAPGLSPGLSIAALALLGLWRRKLGGP